MCASWMVVSVMRRIWKPVLSNVMNRTAGTSYTLYCKLNSIGIASVLYLNLQKVNNLFILEIYKEKNLYTTISKSLT